MAAQDNGQLESLTVHDYSDVELLFQVRDEVSAETGYATTESIAKAIGIVGEHPNQSVGGRLAYLRSIGAVVKSERQKDGRSQWAVTQIGEDMIDGKLKVGQISALDTATPAQRVLLARRLARLSTEEGLMVGKVMGREWRRETNSR